MSKNFLAAVLIFVTVTLVSFTGFFYFKSTNAKKNETREFSDIDEVYVQKKCVNKEFSSHLGFCHTNKLCKPGLYCSAKGVCLKEKALGSVCSRDSECKRTGFASVKCILGTCGVVRGPGESCEINDRCSSGFCSKGKCQNGRQLSYNSEGLTTNYCSNYLNSLHLLKSCMRRNCGNDGTTFGFFIDTTETCPLEKCSYFIKAMRNAAFEEFSTKYDEQGEVVFENNEAQPAAIEEREVEPSLDIKDGCQTSQVEVAQFGISGSELFITFTNPLASSVFSLCSSVSNIFTNVTSFGSSPTCSFPTANQLRVVLGTSPSIKPGNSLTFKDVLLVKGGCNSTKVNGTVTFNANPDATAPVISLLAPSKITVCDSLSISASGTTGSGQLSYEWVLDTTGQYVSNAGISAYLAGLSKSSSSIQISTTLLKSAVFGKFKFDLTVIDYFGQNSKASAIVELSSNQNDPQVTLNNPTKNEILRNTDFTLTSSLVKSSCLSSAVTNVYTWKVTPTVATTATDGSIKVAKYLLTKDTTYTFTLDVSVQQNGIEIGNSTSTTQLKAVAPALVASIAGASPQGIGNTSPLTVDASGSSDPNVANGVNANAKFAWTCCAVSSTSGVCNTQTCLAAFADLSAHTANKYTKAAPLPVGTFKFTVTYSDTPRSSKASKTIVVANGNNIVTLESVKQGRYTFSTNIANPTWTTEVESGSFTVKEYKGTKLIVEIPRSSITVSGTLEVKASANGAEAELKVPVQVVSPPFGGSVKLLFRNGTASSNTLVSGSEYIIEAAGWKADGDIFYEFYGDFLGGQSFSKSNRFTCSPFAVQANTASNIKVTISVYSTVYEEYVSVDSTVQLTIGAYTVPQGKSYEQAANETLSNIETLANSGDTTAALQAVGQSSNILKLSSAPKGSTARKALKEQVAKGLQTVLSKSTTLTTGTKLVVVSIAKTLIADANEFTAVVKSNVISGLEALYSGNGATFTGNTDVLGVIESLFTLTPVALDSSDLLQSYSLSQAEVAKIRTILRGVGRSTALGISDYTATPPKIDSASIKMQVNRFAFNVPTTELTMLSDNSVRLAAAGGISTGTVNIVDLYTIKFASTFFPYVTALSRENISTPIVSFELYNGETNTKIAVVSNPQPILFTISATSVKASSNCRFINEGTTRWDSTGVNITSATAGTSVVCNTNHFTDFAGFDVPNDTPTTPVTPPTTTPPPDNTGYLALLLLIIPVGVVVLILVVVGVGAVIFAVTTIVNKNKGSDRTPLNTQAAVGLEDLGI